jgi:hypothetical protein
MAHRGSGQKAVELAIGGDFVSCESPVSALPNASASVLGSDINPTTRTEVVMAIDWSVITDADVRRACDLVASRRTRDKESGLVVFAVGCRLPAKEVLREAYRLAKGLPDDAEVKFASGEVTLNVLRRLGFPAKRLTARTNAKP